MLFVLNHDFNKIKKIAKIANFAIFIANFAIKKFFSHTKQYYKNTAVMIVT